MAVDIYNIDFAIAQGDKVIDSDNFCVKVEVKNGTKTHFICITKHFIKTQLLPLLEVHRSEIKPDPAKVSPLDPQKDPVLCSLTQELMCLNSPHGTQSGTIREWKKSDHPNTYDGDYYVIKRAHTDSDYLQIIEYTGGSQ